METAKYYRRRFSMLAEASYNQGVLAYKEIRDVFTSTEDYIDKELNALYMELSSLGSLSMSVVNKRLTPKELSAFKVILNEYIREAKNDKWDKFLRAMLIRQNISRLDRIKLSLRHYLEVAFDEEEEIIFAMAARVYERNYYGAAYEIQRWDSFGSPLGDLDLLRIEKIIVKPWSLDNLTFSDRIWRDKTKLISTLHNRLTQNIILGKPPHKLINDISKMFNTAKHNARRLVMTETAYFHTLASRDAFDDLGVYDFEFSSVLDTKTSDLCSDMDGKVFKLRDLEVGVNAPPMHPNCRSVIIPYYSDTRYGMRAARDADGKTYDVPADMSYKDWYALAVSRSN